MVGYKRILALTFVMTTLWSQVIAGTSEHHYKSGERVAIYGSMVGPYWNARETYGYYELPFCSPDHLVVKEKSLSEMLTGPHLVTAAYKLDFKVDKELEVLCSKRLTREEVSRFRMAVANHYYLQMYCDDLPIWAFVGQVNGEGSFGAEKYNYFIHTGVHFDIYYNKDQVIEVIARTDSSSLANVTDDKEVDVEFMYSVKWRETDTPFEKRMEKYLVGSYLPRHLKIHQFSIMNSSITLLILVFCLGSFYMRVLKRDFYKSADDEELADSQDERGWKSLHGDVFRFPKCKSLFAAALGTGSQLLTMASLILLLGLLDVLRPFDGGFSLITSIMVYILTYGIAGFKSASFYSKIEGNKWVKTMFLTGAISCGPLFLAFCLNNTIATAYRSTAAFPLYSIAIILALLVFLAFPLLLLGGIYGKKVNSEFVAPCRTTRCPREIPQLRWYRHSIPQMVIAGFIPFGIIYIQLYYIFAALWGHRVYTLYSILSIVFFLLLIVTALVSVALTYFQLAAEDHEWWWRSFLYGGSTGLYMFAYCFHYYFSLSGMSGFLQSSLFFSYMACICFGMFLMLGTVGFHAALLFVCHIYGFYQV